ncbi:hypothetical protein PEDI_35960 [Persicobacter diffluens]|uniref:Uncharacterized protein n=1 Tax=Persicobacter diffluens TaxID=981 RepID=A0AAN4VZN5_9BACT|nr:hypothetical protein PEDI_35960 [Persicobacter diffluens]
MDFINGIAQKRNCLSFFYLSTSILQLTFQKCRNGWKQPKLAGVHLVNKKKKISRSTKTE